MEESKNSENN